MEEKGREVRPPDVTAGREIRKAVGSIMRIVVVPRYHDGPMEPVPEIGTHSAGEVVPAVEDG